MTAAEHGLLVGDPSYVTRAQGFAAELSDRASEIEDLRHIPQDIADRLAEAGLYVMCNPASYGGSGASPAAYADVVETLAKADASVGWCTFIAITSAFHIATAGTDAIRDLLRTKGVKTAGVFAPNGRARRAEENGSPGYLVNGRWAWGSGSQNADWITGGAFVVDDSGELIRGSDGQPQNIGMVFPAKDVRFHDTWKVMGLQGTGSTDFEVKNLFVPIDRTVAGFGDRSDDAPIFRFPSFGMLAIGIGSVALGATRGAIDDLITLASEKTPVGSRSKLSEKSETQRLLARAEATVRSGRAFLREAIDEAWSSALMGPISVTDRRNLRLATNHAVYSARTAIGLVHELAGGSSVYRNSTIQRRFRDVHVASLSIGVQTGPPIGAQKGPPFTMAQG